VSLTPSSTELDDLARMAKALCDSGYWDDLKTAQQAFAKLIFGRDLGLGPSQSLTEIFIIKGKVELSANAQAALLQKHPDYDYRVNELTNELCSITVLKHGEPIGTSTFTMDDAKQGQLGGQMYSKFPRNMLFARCLTNAVAWYAPETTATRTFSPGEVGGPITEARIELPVAASTFEDKPALEVASPVIEATVVEAEPVEGADKEYTMFPQSGVLTAKQRKFAAMRARHDHKQTDVEFAGQVAKFLELDIPENTDWDVWCEERLSEFPKDRFDDLLTFISALPDGTYTKQGAKSPGRRQFEAEESLRRKQAN